MFVEEGKNIAMRWNTEAISAHMLWYPGPYLVVLGNKTQPAEKFSNSCKNRTDSFEKVLVVLVGNCSDGQCQDPSFPFLPGV